MKRTLLAVLATLVVTTSATKAEAKIVEIWGAGLIGYAYGEGSTDKDFFRFARGGAGGFEVGAKLLFFSAFIDYLRFFGGTAGANLLGINLGGDGDINLAGSVSLILRAAGTFYVGTLPSDAAVNQSTGAMVNTRGVGARGGLGLRYGFLKVLSVQLLPEVGYHYFFGGAEQSVLSDNSSGWDFRVMAYLRAGIGI